MKSTKELLARIEEIQERARQRKPAQASTTADKVVQLPLWPEPVRAVPNGFLRSALFGAIRKGRRRFVKGEKLAALDGIEIHYTGERLDQNDLDVYESILHIGRLQELGSQCRITSYALLKLMGKTNSGANRIALQTRIERLRANAVRIRQGRYTYIGGLVDEAYKDEKTQEWVIVLNPKLRALYGSDQFTQTEWATRRALNNNQLAKWLHGFYSSHAEPYPLKVETLHRLSGSEAELRRYRQTLNSALDTLAKACEAHSQPFSYEIAGDLVHVDRQGSKAQRRHLAKKARQVRNSVGTGAQ